MHAVSGAPRYEVFEALINNGSMGTYLVSELQYCEAEAGNVLIGKMNSREIILIDDRISFESRTTGIIKLKICFNKLVGYLNIASPKNGNYLLFIDGAHIDNLDVYAIKAVSYESDEKPSDKSSKKTDNVFNNDISNLTTDGDIFMVQNNDEVEISLTSPKEKNNLSSSKAPIDFSNLEKQKQSVKKMGDTLAQNLIEKFTQAKKQPLPTGVIGTIKQCTECHINLISQKGGGFAPDIRKVNGISVITLGTRKVILEDGTHNIIREDDGSVRLNRVGDFHVHE